MDRNGLGVKRHIAGNCDAIVLFCSGVLSEGSQRSVRPYVLENTVGTKSEPDSMTIYQS